MISLAIVIILAYCLYRMRRFTQQRMQGLAYILTGSKKIGIYFYHLIFFPGVVIHELTHFFMAAMLGVRTGEIKLWPTFQEDHEKKQRVALGFVKIAKTDFVRSSIIGAAPFLSGFVILYMLAEMTFSTALTWNSIPLYIESLAVDPLKWLWTYLILVIGNTMFVSKEDARAWPVLFIFFGGIYALIWWFGQQNIVITFLEPLILRMPPLLIHSMLIAVGLSFMASTGLFCFEKIVEKISKRKIIYH